MAKWIEERSLNLFARLSPTSSAAWRQLRESMWLKKWPSLCLCSPKQCCPGSPLSFFHLLHHHVSEIYRTKLSCMILRVYVAFSFLPMENMIDTDVDTLQRCTDLKKADQS